MQNFFKNLYTIVLDYKEKTHIYQIIAKDSKEAKLKWVKEIDLDKINAINTKEIREELIADAMDDDSCPKLLNGLQSVWYASSCACSFGDEIYCATAHIITTSTQKNIDFSRNNLQSTQKSKLPLFNVSKNKNLYSIQLDYKGNTDVHQVFADNPLDAKIIWINQIDLSKLSGAPRNIVKVKEDLLSQAKDLDFYPISVDGMDSVWNTSVQLGDAIGRVTIVATQSNVINL